MHIEKRYQLTGHRAAVYALAAGPQPGTFYSAGGDGWLVYWSLRELDEQGEPLGKLVAKVEGQLFSLAYLPGSHTLVAGDMNGGVHWLNLNEDQPNRHLAHHRKGTYGILPSGPESSIVYTIGGDGVFTRWDSETQRSLDSLKLSPQALRTVVALPNGNLLIGSSDHHIYQVSPQLELLNKFKAHDNSVFALLPHPTQTDQVLSGGRDAQLRHWQLSPSSVELSTRPAHWFTINDLIATPDGNAILSASRDKTIRVWTSDDLSLRKTLDAARDGGHVNSVNRLLWLAGTDSFVSVSDDRSICVWECSP